MAATSGEASGLKTDGLYSWSRNPQYVADILILIGWGILAASLWSLPVLAIGLAVLLVAPFAEQNVASVGGFVRGRNGISYQNTARWVGVEGDHEPIEIEDDARVFETTPDRALKTEGTNCAFRRAVLCDIGGFDQAFRFYLDETDVNMRLARMAETAAIAPMAEVHHGFFESASRGANRMPKTLFEIGASQAIYLRKFSDPKRIETVLNSFRAEQRARLIRHLNAGTCEPRDVGRLMNTLEAGIAEGRQRDFGQTQVFSSETAPFHRFNGRINFVVSETIFELGFRTRRAFAGAQEMLKSGVRPSIFVFSRTALYHRVAFIDGIWVQTGGVFGKSNRTDKLIRFAHAKSRLRREIARISVQRGIELTY